MADNVSITAGSGTVVGTDERTINSTSVQVQRVDEQGSTTLANAHVDVTNSATTIAAARETRKRLVIVNYQNVAIYVGLTSPTTSTGLMVPPGGSLTLYTTAAVQGITAASHTASGEDEKVHYLEEYDS